MNIDELQAGRELDAFVAENVMAWTDCREWDFEDGGKQWRGTNGDGTKCMPIPCYSTRINDTWQIIQVLQGRGYGINIAVPSKPEALCSIWDMSKLFREPMVEAKASTPSLAICRAALKTIYPRDL